jgi:hypothetical protein
MLPPPLFVIVKKRSLLPPISQDVSPRLVTSFVMAGKEETTAAWRRMPNTIFSIHSQAVI